MTDDIQRDLGRLEAQVEGVIRKLDDLDKDVKQINKTLSEAAGGWKILMMIGGASGTVGAAITYFLQYFHFKPG